MKQILQPITAFVYCNPQAPPAAGERRKFQGASRHLRNCMRPWTPHIL